MAGLEDGRDGLRAIARGEGKIAETKALGQGPMGEGAKVGIGFRYGCGGEGAEQIARGVRGRRTMMGSTRFI